MYKGVLNYKPLSHENFKSLPGHIGLNSTNLERWIRIWIEKYAGSKLKFSCEWGYRRRSRAGCMGRGSHGLDIVSNILIIVYTGSSLLCVLHFSRPDFLLPSYVNNPTNSLPWLSE